MPRWLPSAWPDHLLPILVAAVEVAAIAPWLHLLAGMLGHGGAPVPAPLGIALAGLLGFGSARWFLAGGWDIGAARLMSLGLWLLLVIGWLGVTGAGIGAPLTLLDGLIARDGALYALLVVAGVAWWRGLALGVQPEPFSPAAMRSRLEIVIGLLVAALIVAALVGGAAGEQALNAAASALPVVLIGGLVALSTAQARAVRVRVRQESSGWIGAGALVAVGIVLLALLLAGIAGPEVWRQVLSPVLFILRPIGWLLDWALLGLAYAIFLLLTPLMWLLRKLSGGVQQVEEPQVEPGPPLDFQGQVQSALPGWLLQVLEIALIGAAILLGVWLVLRTLRRFRPETLNGPVDEIRESVWSREAALDQLRGWLRGLEAPWGGGQRRGRYDLNRPPKTVREAYQHLLVLAARRGQPRVPAESPIDYATRMQERWPSVDQPLDDLTRRYLRARYGEHESPTEAEQARVEWETIRDSLPDPDGQR